MMRWALAALILGIASSPGSAQLADRSPTEVAPTILEAYNRAKSLIEAAVAAHGGIEALRAVRHARITMAGFDFHPTQGRRFVPPYDSTVRRFDVMIDLTRNQLVSTQTTGWPGGFHYTTRFVTNGDKFFNVAPRNQNYSVQQGWDPADRQFGSLFRVPNWYLLAAYESTSPGARRYLGPIRLGPNGPIVEAVHFTIPPSGNVVIGFDPESHRLRATMSVGTDLFTGDTEVYTEFLDWRMLDGLLLPSRATVHRGGNVVQDLRFTSATLNYQIPDSLLGPPAHYAVAPPNPPMQPAQELAPGVWLAGSGYRSLLVAFDDYVVVVDAPSSTSAEVITQAASLAPGKPIRYVVPTHHHDDHFLGVRYHAAAGTTIVTTAGNTDYLRRIMAAPMSSLMLARNQAGPSSSYRVEAIEGDRRVFSGGSRRLEIHRIPSPHADDMLIAWLPAEGILFQADLIEAPQAGVALRGANSETTQHLAEVIRSRGWKVRVFAGSHASLQGPEVFEELVRLPIIPPVP
jgi:glyoxylase-like metal-dependent hydrolase (beta-lactamase superfamily II)